MRLKPPFAYFGNKMHAATEIWKHFGTPDIYLEPFAGSLGCLLRRPGWRTGVQWAETVNDQDGFITNVWRAIKYDPDSVIQYANDASNEIDLRSRHAYINSRRESLCQDLVNSPDYFDTRIAGWWVWGQCNAVMGLWQREYTKGGLQIDGKNGKMTRGVSSRNFDFNLIRALSDRLRWVVCLNGDRDRCLTKSCLAEYGSPRDVAILLDPPYNIQNRTGGMYAHESDVSSQVRAWALENGGQYKIALCGMTSELEMPDSWQVWYWSGSGGKGSSGNGGEVVWFSPRCTLSRSDITSLFS